MREMALRRSCACSAQDSDEESDVIDGDLQDCGHRGRGAYCVRDVEGGSKALQGSVESVKQSNHREEDDVSKWVAREGPAREEYGLMSVLDGEPRGGL